MIHTSGSVKENLEKTEARIASAAAKSGRSRKDITLVAVTKGASIPQILEAKALGLEIFGENKVQEAGPKITEIGAGSQWHMIGHLQSNKVPEAVSLFSMIQSVDTARLAEKINTEAQKQNKVMPILLEINASGEEQKYGFAPEEIYTAIEEISVLEHLEVLGVMGMAPNSEDPAARREAFKKLRSIFSVCKSIKKENIKMKHLSMGMSDDFEVAIEEGANMVRLGRVLFK